MVHRSNGVLPSLSTGEERAGPPREGRGLRDSAWRVAENVAEYLSEESGAVASRHALEDWSAEVRRVRDDSERTAKRIALLQARLNAIAARVDKE